MVDIMASGTWCLLFECWPVRKFSLRSPHTIKGWHFMYGSCFKRDTKKSYLSANCCSYQLQHGFQSTYMCSSSFFDLFTQNFCRRDDVTQRLLFYVIFWRHLINESSWTALWISRQLSFNVIAELDFAFISTLLQLFQFLYIISDKTLFTCRLVLFVYLGLLYTLTKWLITSTAGVHLCMLLSLGLYIS